MKGIVRILYVTKIIKFHLRNFDKKINTSDQNSHQNSTWLRVELFSFIYVDIKIRDGEYTNNVLRRNKFIMTA